MHNVAYVLYMCMCPQVCGYDGPIFMTYPTRAITPVMLEDYHKVRAQQTCACSIKGACGPAGVCRQASKVRLYQKNDCMA